MKREIPPQSQTLSTDSASASPARWHLDRIVAELRVSREETHSIRRDGEARRAPSRDALEAILNGLTEALFPRHYGQSDLDGENIDYFVGNTLSIVLDSLCAYPKFSPHLLHVDSASLVCEARIAGDDEQRLEPGQRRDDVLHYPVGKILLLWIAAHVLERKHGGKLLSSLNSPAILFADHAAPRRQALGRMLLHPLRELRRAHQAGLH
jgi:hypothetical protein